MTHRTFNESGRAVGFVNHEVRNSRDAKKPCVIFIQQLGESFARPTAILTIKGVADPNYSATICNVPPHVNQLFIQQVHMSTNAEFIAFTASCDANNPNSRSGVPMLFKRVPTKNTARTPMFPNGVNGGGAKGAASATGGNNNSGTGDKLTTASFDLEACDHYIKSDDDLNGDTLQSVYFPQYVSIGDVGTTHIVCVCRAENGTRTCYTVKLQGGNSGGFSLFGNFFKRTKKIAAATSRHVPGTDIILTCQHKMSDNASVNLAVRHFSLHTITNSGNFERIFEVSIAPELSRTWPGETLMNGYIFWEGSAKDEFKLSRELSLGTTQASSSNHFHLPKISSFVVAYIKFDFPVRSEDCGAITEKEFVNRHVVRLFVFRPRNKHNGYQGSDWYIDLYFSKKNIAIFQISSLGQMCVMCPGYKAYFIDVKYFGHDIGPSVSVVQYLDSQSVAQQSKITGAAAAAAAAAMNTNQQNNAQRLSPSTSTPPNAIPIPNNNNNNDPRAVPIPPKSSTHHHHELSSSAAMASTSGSLKMLGQGQSHQQQQRPSGLNLKSVGSNNDVLNSNIASPIMVPPAQQQQQNNNNNLNNNNNQQQKRRTSSGLSSSNGEATLEESCFLGEKFPDCFLRPNCIPSKLSPIEINAEQGKFVVFFSTHISSVLYFDSRKPMWQSAQFACLLRDKYRKRVPGSERNHDGEHAARGILAVMDRVALSLVSRTTITAGGTANSLSPSNNNSAKQQHAGASGTPVPSLLNHTNNNVASSASPGTIREHQQQFQHHLIFGNSLLTNRIEIDDTLAAFHTIIPVFQQMATQLRDPVAICMEWIIGAAYLRLGTRCQSPPPRLTFDFSHYEGLIHPMTLPRTTAHARLRGFGMRTALITGGVETNGAYGRLISVQPRDPFVKALELRIEEVQYRDELIKGFKKFVAYEECLMEFLFPEIFRKVKENLEPSPLARFGRGNILNNNNNTRIGSKPAFPNQPTMTTSSVTPIASVGQLEGGVGGTSPQSIQQPQTSSPSPQQQQHQNQNEPTSTTAAANNNHSSGIRISPELHIVNQFCFLLSRLTALDILGVRVEEKAPVFTSSLIYAAANDDLLPFNALARAIWQRNISNQVLDRFSVLLNPLSRFANRENDRLNVRVTGNNTRVSSDRGTFFLSQQRERKEQFQRDASDENRKREEDENAEDSTATNSQQQEGGEKKEKKIPSLRSFASNSESRSFYPSFAPSFIIGKPFDNIALPSLLPMTARNTDETSLFAEEVGVSTSKNFLENLRNQF